MYAYYYISNNTYSNLKYYFVKFYYSTKIIYLSFNYYTNNFTKIIKVNKHNDCTCI